MGRIQGQNLLKIDVGSVFALGTRRYRIIRIQGDRIEVSPTPESPNVTLAFGGSAAELDATLLESELQLLIAGGGADVTPPARAAQLASSLSEIWQAQQPDTLLYCRRGERVWHLTFGGRLLNSLIALWLPSGSPTAGEVCLAADEVLDLTALPTTVQEFGDLLREIDPTAGRQSIFQPLLPPELLVRERLDTWHRRPVLNRTLKRLRHATPLEIPAPVRLDLDVV